MSTRVVIPSCYVIHNTLAITAVTVYYFITMIMNPDIKSLSVID